MKEAPTKAIDSADSFIVNKDYNPPVFRNWKKQLVDCRPIDIQLCSD
jgi:hypothetical protein